MNNKKMGSVRLKMFLGILGLYIALPLFILNTNPKQLPLPFLLVPFILAYTGIFILVYFIGSKTPLLRGLDGRSRYGVTALLAAIPLLLMVFQSLHQLTIRDVVIAVGLVFVTAFYISRADFLR